MSGGLMGFIKLRITKLLQNKQPFDFTCGSLHLYVYIINESGLGIIDEYIDYFISELDNIDDDTIRDVDENGCNTLLHQLCFHSGRGGHQFSYRLFEYFIKRGVDVSIKNNDGKGWFDFLQNEGWNKTNCILK
jgi:hypothetical protein